MRSHRQTGYGDPCGRLSQTNQFMHHHLLWTGMLFMCCVLFSPRVWSAEKAHVDEFDLRQPYGVAAMSLGPAVKMPPTIDEKLSDWRSAVVLNRFYQIMGLDAPVTPVEARFLWDETALHVLCTCADPGEARYAVKRQDQIEIFLCGGYPRVTAYEQFVILNTGRIIQSHIDQEKLTEITPPLFSAQVKRQATGWVAMVTIPWQIIGGKPAAPFNLMLLRERQQYSDTTSPIGLTRRWAHQQDPALFIETTLGATARTQTIPGSLITLPSGVRHWQPPALLTWPNTEERKQLWVMQQHLNEPTTQETLASRLYLAQRMHDLLRLEGYSLDPGQNILLATHYTMETLEDTRTAVNAYLRNNDLPSTCLAVDSLLKHFDAISRQWFADESPGDIDDGAWSALDRLDRVEQQDKEVLLHGTAGGYPVILRLSCPALGGVRLRADAEGFFKPQELAPLHLTQSRGQYVITSPTCTITLRSGAQWGITVMDTTGKQPRWQVQHGDMRFRFAPNGRVLAVDLQWRLARDEVIYGLGERFNAVNQRGKVVSLWDTDCWEASSTWGFENQAYKIVQLLHSTRGYSLFFNSTYRLRADVGNGNPERCRLTVNGPVLDVYVWTTPPAQVLDAYTSLTGKPLLPPRWVFEPWAGGGGGRWANGPAKNATQEIINVMQRFRELDIPHSAVYAEGDASADPRLYTELAPYQTHILTWGRSQVWGRYNRYLPDVPENEWPIMRFPDGKPVQYPRSYSGASNFPYIDFTNPHALDVLRAFWKRHLDLGVAGSMVDFGDMVPENAKFADGRTGDAMHNFYAYDYHRVFHQLYTEMRGDDFVLFSRSAAPGSQAFCCQMAGDQESNFYGMTAALRGGLNLAASGFPFWGCDIGGYGGRPDEETYLRWVEYGAFSPLMRVHGTEPREPWAYNDDAVRVYKKYAWVRENLLDYLYSAAIDAHHTGVPLMQPMPMAFPGQPKLATIDDEYLFGPDLLVAPVHTAGEMRPITLPPGRWTNLWNGTVISGGTTLTVAVPMDEIPVYLRPGAIVPVQISQNLILGESMSTGKVSALLLTLPAEKRTVQYRQTPTQSVNYTVTPTRNGMSITLGDPAGVQYLLLYGAATPVTHVMVDGVALPGIEKAQQQETPSGWYREGARIVIHLPQQAVQSVTVTFK